MKGGASVILVQHNADIATQLSRRWSNTCRHQMIVMHRNTSWLEEETCIHWALGTGHWALGTGRSEPGNQEAETTPSTSCMMETENHSNQSSDRWTSAVEDFRCRPPHPEHFGLDFILLFFHKLAIIRLLTNKNSEPLEMKESGVQHKAS